MVTAINDWGVHLIWKMHEEGKATQEYHSVYVFNSHRLLIPNYTIEFVEVKVIFRSGLQKTQGRSSLLWMIAN